MVYSFLQAHIGRNDKLDMAEIGEIMHPKYSLEKYTPRGSSWHSWQ